MTKNDEIPTPEEMSRVRLNKIEPKIQAIIARVLTALQEHPCITVKLEPEEHVGIYREVIYRFDAKGWKATAGTTSEGECWLRVEPK